jgi:replicative DNA helicase
MITKAIEKYNPRSLKTNKLSVDPVYNVELELDTLATLAFNSQFGYMVEILDEDDFYSLENREIFNWFKSEYKQKQMIDVSAAPKDIKPLIVDITNRHLITAGFEKRVETLKDISAKRKIQDIAYKATVMAIEERGLEDIRNFILGSCEQISGYRSGAKKLETSYIDEKFEEYLSGKELPAISTGFSKLDRYMGGFLPGSLNIIAAAQGIGKTSWIINAINNVCSKGKKALVVSLEMSHISLYGKLVSVISKVSNFKMLFKKGELNEVDWTEINRARAKISEYKIERMEVKDTCPADIKAKLSQTKDIDIVFVDYLQMLKPNDKAGSIYEATTNIVKTLKNMATEFNIPLVVIASINRDYSDRKDSRPHIADMRDSGAIEYTADTVLLLHREYAYKDLPDEARRAQEAEHEAEIVIAKNRYGQANIEIEMYFDGEIGLFAEVEKEEAESWQNRI